MLVAIIQLGSQMQQKTRTASESWTGICSNTCTSARKHANRGNLIHAKRTHAKFGWKVCVCVVLGEKVLSTRKPLCVCVGCQDGIKIKFALQCHFFLLLLFAVKRDFILWVNVCCKLTPGRTQFACGLINVQSLSEEKRVGI